MLDRLVASQLMKLMLRQHQECVRPSAGQPPQEQPLLRQALRGTRRTSPGRYASASRLSRVP